MRKYTLLVFWMGLLSAQLAIAQMTITVQSVPEHYTPMFDDLYLAGNFNNWSAGDPAYRLTRQPNGNFTITLNLQQGQVYEGKFTRGSWATVESTGNGNFLPNRVFTFQNGANLNLDIAGFEDLTGGNTGTGYTLILDSDFNMPQLNRTRRVWVYLPPDYYTTNHDYPVLYMHDGQNLFDAAFSFAGEWGIDESMQQLVADGYPSAIVVGIDNGGATRIDEYSYWVNQQYGGGQGDEYMDFVVNQLKPFMDNNFRTMPGRATTALMGSSLGGLISYYGGLQYQQTFSKLGLFSPSFWFSPQTFTFPQQVGHQAPFRVYFMAGTTESPDMVPDMQTVYNAMISNGFSPSELNFQTRVDGQHSEWFWRREFPDAYIWLFQDLMTGTSSPTNLPCQFSVYPNPTRDGEMHVKWEQADVKVLSISVTDLMGREVYRNREIPDAIDVSNWGSGLYWLSVQTETSRSTARVLVGHGN